MVMERQNLEYAAPSHAHQGYNANVNSSGYGIRWTQNAQAMENVPPPQHGMKYSNQIDNENPYHNMGMKPNTQAQSSPSALSQNRQADSCRLDASGCHMADQMPDNSHQQCQTLGANNYAQQCEDVAGKRHIYFNEQNDETRCGSNGSSHEYLAADVGKEGAVEGRSILGGCAQFQSISSRKFDSAAQRYHEETNSHRPAKTSALSMSLEGGKNHTAHSRMVGSGRSSGTGDEEMTIVEQLRNLFVCSLLGRTDSNDNTLSDAVPTSQQAPPTQNQRVFEQIIDDFGNRYTGQHIDGKRDGAGTMHYAGTHDTYQGEWVNDRPHGEGKFSRGNGMGEFEGLWKEGALHLVKQGIASVIDQDGNQYDGSFRDWKKHGTGTLTKVDGEKYIGNWVYGVRHGFGTLIYPDMSRFEGVFDNDMPTSEGQTYDPQSFHVGDAESFGQPPMQDVPPVPDQINQNTQQFQRNPLNQPPLSQVPPQEGITQALEPFEELCNMQPKTEFEKKAEKKLIKEKMKIDKAKKKQEQKRKKQMEAMLKAEVKQKKLIEAKLKKEQQKAHERQSLQAKALEHKKLQQEKHFAEAEKRQVKEMEAKQRAFKRLQMESAKKTEMEKKRQEKHLESQKKALLQFEAEQKKALAKQTKELEDAQRRFAEQQKKTIGQQRVQEEEIKRRKARAAQNRTEKERLAKVKERLKQQKDFNAKVNEAKVDLRVIAKQEKKNGRLQEQLDRRIVKDDSLNQRKSRSTKFLLLRKKTKPTSTLRRDRTHTRQSSPLGKCRDEHIIAQINGEDEDSWEQQSKIIRASSGTSLDDDSFDI